MGLQVDCIHDMYAECLLLLHTRGYTACRRARYSNERSVLIRDAVTHTQERSCVRAQQDAAKQRAKQHGNVNLGYKSVTCIELLQLSGQSVLFNVFKSEDGCESDGIH